MLRLVSRTQPRPVPGHCQLFREGLCAPPPAPSTDSSSKDSTWVRDTEHTAMSALANSVLNTQRDEKSSITQNER